MTSSLTLDATKRQQGALEYIHRMASEPAGRSNLRAATAALDYIDVYALQCLSIPEKDALTLAEARDRVVNAALWYVVDDCRIGQFEELSNAVKDLAEVERRINQ